MIEAGWACLLCLAMLDRSTRPLALLLAVKASLCYAAALAGFWTVRIVPRKSSLTKTRRMR